MNIIVMIMEAVLLLCAGMIVILVLHFVALWCFTVRNQSESQHLGKSAADDGLSASDLEKLPKFAGNDTAVTATECAVCLEEIQGDEVARVVPVCQHGFHLECADKWLSKHSVCPLCRSKIRPHFSSPCENVG